jgi:hypothetical protein
MKIQSYTVIDIIAQQDNEMSDGPRDMTLALSLILFIQ